MNNKNRAFTPKARFLFSSSFGRTSTFRSSRNLLCPACLSSLERTTTAITSGNFLCPFWSLPAGAYLYIPLVTQSSPSCLPFIPRADDHSHHIRKFSLSFSSYAGRGVPLHFAGHTIFSVLFGLFFTSRTAAILVSRILLRTPKHSHTPKGGPQSPIPEFFSVQPFLKFASEAQKDDHNP